MGNESKHYTHGQFQGNCISQKVNRQYIGEHLPTSASN